MLDRTLLPGFSLTLPVGVSRNALETGKSNAGSCAVLISCPSTRRKLDNVWPAARIPSCVTKPRSRPRSGASAIVEDSRAETAVAGLSRAFPGSQTAADAPAGSFPAEHMSLSTSSRDTRTPRILTWRNRPGAHAFTYPCFPRCPLPQR